MNPVGFVAKVRLTIFVHVQFVEVSVRTHISPHHPAKRYDASRKCGVTLRGGLKVAVLLRVFFREGMPLDLLHFKRCHKGSTFFDTTRPLILRKLIKTTTCDQFFTFFVLGIRNPSKLSASTIQMRIQADHTGPASVMPGNANGEVAKWNILEVWGHGNPYLS